jgi:hypothetical protein
MKRPGKVRRVTLPPAMDAALVRRAAKNEVTVSAYIVGAIHEAMDRDMFAEMDAEMEAL